MDPLEGNLTRPVASDPRNPRAENSSLQHIQNFPHNTFNHSQYPQNIPTFNMSQFPQNSPTFNHSQYPQNSPPTNIMHSFNPFGTVGNSQQYAQYPTSYQGFQQPPYFQVTGGVFGGGGSSHGSDSVSPQSNIREVEEVEEDSSGSSPNEARRAVRINYSEEENLRLVSAWLKHSVDSVRGIDQTAESYWNNVVHEFNSNRPEGARTRSKGQLKSHWGKISAAVGKFSGVYGRMNFCSGESDDMLMDKARAVFKSENKKKPFTLEYVWKILKDQPKWCRLGMDRAEKSKRTKVDEFGAYTSSSNPDTDEGDRKKEKRPEGQKKAKARMRGKGKDKNLAQSPLGIQPDEDMVLFHEAMSKRADALAKTAAVAAEKVRFDKISKYMEYNMGYYLADGIYPEWATFVKSIPVPLSQKDRLFAQHQESARKDVECAFGILQKRWAIIRHAARLWDREELEDIMMACIILHNMIVEDERDSYQLWSDVVYEEGRSTRPIVGLDHGPIHGFAQLLEMNDKIHDKDTHKRLKADLVEHIWQKFGGHQP